MIIEIFKDYTLSDIHNLSTERYDKLCKIVGEFAIAVKPVVLNITLPFQEDMGCVIISQIKKDTVYVLDARYF